MKLKKQNETILVVDDTQSNIDLLLELLTDYDVVVATDGQIALDILEEDEGIDLILLDIMMPNMNGFEVCQKIKKNPKIANIPIIFLSARSDDESIKKGFEVGGVDYIIKPFRAIELFARIKTHLKLVKHEKNEVENKKRIALKELLHNLSHHWSQPLSVISVSASGMKLKKSMGTMSDETFYQSCDKILEGTNYLASTIKNFEKIITDEGKEVFNLKNFISANKEFLTKNFGEKNNKILLEIDDNIELFGQKSDFLLLLFQLIKNTKDELENSSNEGLVFIKASKKENYTVINIYDNAGGIKQEIQEKIFDPYFTTRHRSYDKGLGLYNVYNIVKHSFNGDITVSNIEYEHMNKYFKGVNFEIKVPNS